MKLSIQELLVQYRYKLTELDSASSHSPSAILSVLLLRDRIQRAVDNSFIKDSSSILQVARLDQMLKRTSTIIHETIKLEDLRLSYNPPESFWWWFLDRDKAYQRSSVDWYEANVLELDASLSGKLKQNVPLRLIDQLIRVFGLRDKVQSAINRSEISSTSLLKIAEIDKQLKQAISRFSQAMSREQEKILNDTIYALREVLAPPPSSWWWYTVESSSKWNYLEPLWVVLVVFWLAGTFGLLTDIASRFLVGEGPGTFGTITVVLQSILAIIGGGALTNSGKLIVNRILTSWRVPQRFWHQAKFVGATALLLFFIGFRLSLPKISVLYNNSATKDYVVGNLDSAESKLKRALKLDPGYIRAHYNLGAVYEALGKQEEAKIQYNFAIAGKFIPAYNNQARLSILAKDYATAVSLLEKGISRAKFNDTDKFAQNNTSPFVEHDLWKNLGWARLEQGYYTDAEETLKAAISVSDSTDDLQEAAPHCLLGQTYEKLSQPNKAQLSWQQCLRLPKNPDNPEEDGWQKMAQERL